MSKLDVVADRLMDPDDLRPVYLRIAEELRRAYKPGAQLPSVPKISEEWGVAKETARSAIEVLRNEKLVVSWQGRGTFYRVPIDTEDGETAAGSTINDPAVLERLDAIMARLDIFETRITQLEQSQER